MSAESFYITNIDISNVVIEQMIEKSTQDYLVMDACNMTFSSQSFDVVLDKGTYDALAVLTK